ncbi:MAG: hypothetical protein UX80_C0006G0020 [Candidatus Amesbacteria bacterium GW2011_GWA2_47_11b]|uniref:DUF1648 domain-containing protein n=3 Tax=Candidatus Amesiibacteriota TaxID=1752730 RepID=A0A0G1UPV2_9BACT|nr:MAG: hypothetical protein UX42_C0003G0016 [Microgenomates group bacterium GW2011_GWC1_46_20]KKU58050.1 MAG: hypothetical protein UX80_C0006G0020 [Candidatus Amesbacteria bacterium GW2011_GWA2_47_11b]KKU68088.1 MAG: hypothetical protein UX92_C0024G0023 [Candidatus Amesbacteria bacterium GW2011_GWA1_47_20]KKU83508.1 MAG: hypothetical protein UY11_C0018G0007 [Candidatus Amesbacteria bacterium GW2011_GWC2_47_8]
MMQKLLLWNWRVMTAGAVVGAGLLAIYWKSLPPEVPLLYSRPWGQDQLVSPIFLIVPPIFAVVVGGLLGWLANQSVEEKLLPIIILVSSMVVQVVTILGLIRIVLLVV